MTPTSSPLGSALRITGDSFGANSALLFFVPGYTPDMKLTHNFERMIRVELDSFGLISTPKAKASPKKSVKEPQEESAGTPAFDPLAAFNASNSSFTAYDDIRSKLIAGGIPPEQIAFIHDANTETRKKELFAKVRTGQVRVLMGRTFKMGAGRLDFLWGTFLHQSLQYSCSPS